MPRQVPLSDFIGFVPTELILPEDKIDLLPGEMGIYYTGPEAGAIYFRNPYNEELFSPNKLDAETVQLVTELVTDKLISYSRIDTAIVKNVDSEYDMTVPGLANIELIPAFSDTIILATPTRSVNTFVKNNFFTLKTWDPAWVVDSSTFIYDDVALYSIMEVQDNLILNSGKVKIEKRVGEMILTPRDYATLITTYANINYIKIQLPSAYDPTKSIVLEGGFNLINKPADLNTAVDKSIFKDVATGCLYVAFAKATTKVAIDALLAGKTLLYGLGVPYTISDVHVSGTLRTYPEKTKIRYENAEVNATEMNISFNSANSIGGSLDNTARSFGETLNKIEEIINTPGLRELDIFYKPKRKSSNQKVTEFNPLSVLARMGERVTNDAEFILGANGIVTLGAITSTRTTDTTAPTQDKTVYRYTHGIGVITPDLGGFQQPFTLRTYGHATHVFIAKLPIGFRFACDQNILDAEGNVTFLGSAEGTGKYETYIVLYQNGASEPSVGKITVKGDKNTVEPFDTYVAASQIYELTNFTEEFLRLAEISVSSSANKVPRMDGSGLLTVSTTGNAGTATKLATARTITVSTDVTGSVSFDGSANVTLALTLANSGVTAGTYKSVTVDAKGRVTAGTNPTTLSGYGITDAIAASDVVTIATANKILKLDGAGLLPTGITGNAGTATKLVTARTISVSTDATGSVSFDGSANVTLALTLANSGVTAGTYRSVTVDIKGRITAGTNPTTLVGYGITDAVALTEYNSKINQDVRTTASPTFVSPTVQSIKIKTGTIDFNTTTECFEFKFS